MPPHYCFRSCWPLGPREPTTPTLLCLGSSAVPSGGLCGLPSAYLQQGCRVPALRRNPPPRVRPVRECRRSGPVYQSGLLPSRCRVLREVLHLCCILCCVVLHQCPWRLLRGRGNLLPICPAFGRLRVGLDIGRGAWRSVPSAAGESYVTSPSPRGTAERSWSVSWTVVVGS